MNRKGRNVQRKILAAFVCLAIGSDATAHDLGFAGLLDKRNRTDLAPITLASGKPLTNTAYELKSGGYYKIRIVADGSAELGISGAEFFRSIWINEVVINDIEIRPLGLDSLEFDDEGKAEISFIAIMPGSYVLRIPGTTGETQKAVFNIR